MILFILAIGGLGLVVLFVRYGRTILRWGLYATAATVGLFLWLALGRHNLYVAWAPFILAPVVAFAWWKARDIRKERRALRKALRNEVDENDKKVSAPKVTKVEATDDGTKLHVILPPGQTFRLSPYEKAKLEHRYASLLNCRSVSLSDDNLHGRQGTITIHRGPAKAKVDWLNDVGPWPGPTGGIDKPIPIGRDEHGNIVYTTMLYDNLLIGGIPGSGKSVAMGMFMATAALDPTCEIWTVDGGGGVEMKIWRDRAARQAITERQAFILFQDLKAEVDRRLTLLMEGDRQKIEPGEPTILLGIEELATYTAKEKKRRYEDGEPAGPKEDGETATEALTYIARLGRKVGVMLLANTQRPSATVVDPNFRDLMGKALALYCKTGPSSDTILGDGWRSQGFNASKLNKARKGSAILSPETDTPVKLRCFYVDGDELREIAARSVTTDENDDQNNFPAPVDSLALDTDSISADLCLEHGESVAAPSEIAAAPSAAPYVLDAWDLAVLVAALDGNTGPELYNNIVGGLSAGAARKHLKILTEAGYLSGPPRQKVTDPQLYVTTIVGREALKREGNTEWELSGEQELPS